MKRILTGIMALIMIFSATAAVSAAELAKVGTDNSVTAADTVKAADTAVKKSKSKASPAKIEKQIKRAIGSKNYNCNTKISEKKLSETYGLNMKKIKSYVAKESSVPSVYLDEVIVLKVKKGYADTAVKKLNKAFAQKVDYVRQYPFSVAKVMNARIYKSGNYVAFVLAGKEPSDNMSSKKAAKLAKSEYKKTDKAWKKIFGKKPKNYAVIPKTSEKSDEKTEIANPLREVASAEEMNTLLGYKVPVIEGKQIETYIVIEADGAARHGRIIYSDGAEFDIEKGDADVSGIYGGSLEKTVKINGTEVKIYTFENIRYGIWSDGVYSYSYSVQQGSGDLEKGIQELIEK